MQMPMRNEKCKDIVIITVKPTQPWQVFWGEFSAEYTQLQQLPLHTFMYRSILHIYIHVPFHTTYIQVCTICIQVSV